MSFHLRDHDFSGITRANNLKFDIKIRGAPETCIRGIDAWVPPSLYAADNIVKHLTFDHSTIIITPLFSILK